MRFRWSSSGSGRPGPFGRVGRVAGTLFFGVFLAAGLGAGALFARQGLREAAVLGWNAVPCRVVESWAERTDDGYAFQAEYAYAVAGREHRGSRVRRSHGDGSTDDYADVQRLLIAYPGGSAATCYVDPADPAAAVLTRAPPWWLAGAVPFCLVFAAAGAGGMWATWRGGAGEGDEAGPVSEPSTGEAWGYRGAVAFCVVFAGVGVAVLWGFFVPELLRLRAARSWPAVPATVVSSRVLKADSGGEGGPTYTADVLYEYEFAGRAYRSNRYDGFDGSTSGRSAKRAIVRRHPPGRRVTAYVDPADPVVAVLDRRWKSEAGFALIPLAFVLFGGTVGTALLVSGRRAGHFGDRRAVTGDNGGVRPIHPADARRDEPSAASASPARVFSGRRQRAGQFAGLLGFAVIWNGIVWFMLYQTVLSDGLDAGDLCGGAFLSIFALVGLGAVGAVAHAGLSLFNPSVEVRVEPGVVRPGETARVSWRVTGRVGRLRRLRVSVRGEERATTGGGEDSTTHAEPFAEVDLFAADLPGSPGGPIEGSAEWAVPADAMHSFKADHNEIAWAIVVHGVIRRWPDVSDEHAIEVRPAIADPAADPPDVSPDAEVPDASGSVAPAGGVGVALDLAGGRSNFRPGGVVAGTASWRLDAPPRSAEVRLVWHTEGRGDRDVGVVAVAALDAPPAQAARPFSLAVPADGPHSFAGRVVSVRWSVELVLKPGRRSARREITVSPTGRPTAPRPPG